MLFFYKRRLVGIGSVVMSVQRKREGDLTPTRHRLEGERLWLGICRVSGRRAEEGCLHEPGNELTQRVANENIGGIMFFRFYPAPQARNEA